MSIILSNCEYFIEKQFGLLTRVWVFIFIGPKLLLGVQTLDAKTTKKYCHIGTSVKVEKLDPCSPPIKLLDFLHLSTYKHSVKLPLDFAQEERANKTNDKDIFKHLIGNCTMKC